MQVSQLLTRILDPERIKALAAQAPLDTAS